MFSLFGNKLFILIYLLLAVLRGASTVYVGYYGNHNERVSIKPCCV